MNKRETERTSKSKIVMRFCERFCSKFRKRVKERHRIISPVL